MRKMKFILPCMLLFLTVEAQTLNPTVSISSLGSADNFKGGYTFAYAASGTPWSGSLISYGGAADNGYDTQISSDYGKNRISFRTRNGDHGYWNPWNEIATSLGDNYFAGNQTIVGTVSIGAYQSTSPFSVGNNHGIKLSVGNNLWSNTAIIETGYTAQTGDFTDLKVASYGYSNGLIRILQNGNVGIGASMPSAVLDIYTPLLSPTTYNTQKWSTGNIDYNLTLQTIWNTSGINQRFVQRYNGTDYNSLVFFAGNIGIGKVNPTNKLDVDGTIHSKEVKVDMFGWSDFVFKKEYNLPTLEQVEKHITEKGHLENIPSEEAVLKNGINLGEMNSKLLQKIEELTLYMIEQDKKTENLKMIISEQNKRLEKLENKK